MPTFKIVLVGEGASGKTTTTLRALTGEYRGVWIATMGVEVNPMLLRLKSTATGQVYNVCLNIWDTAGMEKFGGLRDGYFIQADAAIVFARANQAPSRRDEQIVRWSREVANVVGNQVPIYVAFSIPPNHEHNWETGTSLVTPPKLELGKCVGSCFLSACTNLNLMKPFVEIAKTLMGNPNLVLIDNDPVQPAMVTKSNALVILAKIVEQRRKEYEDVKLIYERAKAGEIPLEGKTYEEIVESINEIV